MRKASESLPVTPAVSEIGKVKHRENEHKDQRFEDTDILLIRSAWTVTVNIVVQLDETELLLPHNAPFCTGRFTETRWLTLKLQFVRWQPDLWSLGAHNSRRCSHIDYSNVLFVSCTCSSWAAPVNPL